MAFQRIKKRLKHIVGTVSHQVKPAPHIIPYSPKGRNKVVHVSTLAYSNAGDVVLSLVLRDLFNEQIGVRQWSHRSVRKVVDENDVRLFNRNDFMVIGGGGLLLRDTNANELSGWQWPCSIEKLHAIKVPVIMFAVGYNRFRGQEDFDPIFSSHIRELVKKAAFVGIRNHGSIRMLRSYLPNALGDKLTFQPCMTTLVNKIYPGLFDYRQKEDFVAVNCAFDRPSFRQTDEGVYRSIARVIGSLSKRTRIKYYAHLGSDAKMLQYLDEIDVPYEFVEFSEPIEMLRAYVLPRLVIGMRGHSQMIPFGCSTPILSIVSHDKMAWFLEDIGHPEWGVDVSDPGFETALLEKAQYLYTHTDNVINEIVIQQEKLWDVNQNNFLKIKQMIS